jgi:hypothetical protein
MHVGRKPFHNYNITISRGWFSRSASSQKFHKPKKTGAWLAVQKANQKEGAQRTCAPSDIPVSAFWHSRTAQVGRATCQNPSGFVHHLAAQHRA